MVTDFRADSTADLNRWRAFQAIAELGSLTRAALFLDSNPSLLSRQLNALERDCKARLFNRTGRGLTLSDTGERIFAQVKELLADTQRLEADIRGEAREPAGRVAVASLPSIAHPLVGRLFAQMRARRQGITLEPAIEVDSLPLMKSTVESERLYTVLPLHAVWDEVRQGRLQAARLVDPPLQRTVSMATAQAKGQAKAVAVVARQIVDIVAEMARSGLWHGGAVPSTAPA